MTESKERLKRLLMRVKEESEKDGLKLYIQKIKIMASHPITSWQIKGEKWKQWLILFSWTLKSQWKWLQPWNKKILFLYTLENFHNTKLIIKKEHLKIYSINESMFSILNSPMNSRVFITTLKNYPNFFYLYSYSLLSLLCCFKENLIHHVI